MLTRTRTWSTAKSIAVTLIGMLADQGKMNLDAPLGIDWLPELALGRNRSARQHQPASPAQHVERARTR